MARQKKTWRTWTSALLVALAGLLGQAHADEGEAAGEPWAPVQTGPDEEFVRAQDPVIQRLQALYDAPPSPREETPPAGGSSITMQALKTLMVLCALCGVVIVLGYLARKYLSKTPVLAGMRLGTVLGRVYLTPKASLHYVRTGGRVLVVGVTPTGVQLLTEFAADAFDAALGAAPAPEAPEADTGGPNFIEYLSAAQRPARAGTGAGADEDIANLRGEIQRLSEFLRESGRESQG